MCRATMMHTLRFLEANPQWLATLRQEQRDIVAKYGTQITGSSPAVRLVFVSTLFLRFFLARPLRLCWRGQSDVRAPSFLKLALCSSSRSFETSEPL